MIEVKIKQGPQSCPACERSLQHGQEQTTCEACGRSFHQACWAERGCEDCAASASPSVADGGDPAAEGAPLEAEAGGQAAAPQSEPPRWLDDPANVKTLLKVFWGLCAALILVDGLDLLGVYERHPHFPLEGVPGFYAFYGFLACTCLVFTAKGLRKIVMRSEDYYDRG